MEKGGSDEQQKSDQKSDDGRYTNMWNDKVRGMTTRVAEVRQRSKERT